jgi:hypothetical protein
MPTSLIKKGRVRTQVKSAPLREPPTHADGKTNENEENEVLPPLQAQSQAQTQLGRSATVLPPSKNQAMETKDWYLTEPIWTDIPIARSLTIQADEELWPETQENSIQHTQQANRFQYTAQVFPEKDALLSVLVQGQKGQVIYDVGGSMDYTIRNGGVHWKTPGLESWMGAIPQRRSLAQSLKQRAILWQTGASWNFTEENALWTVSMNEPQSRVQWKVGSSWLTEVQDGAIQFVIPDAGHWWIRTQRTPDEPPLPHPQMGFHSRGTLSLKADRSAQIESRHLDVLLDSYQGFIKQRWRQQQNTLQYAIGDQTSQRQYITKPGDQTNYHIDSWNGDWDWTLWNGQFQMNLYHRPEETKTKTTKEDDENDESEGGRPMGWQWATPETNSYWAIQLGNQSWKWNQDGCIWDIRGDSSYLSQTGGFTWIGEKEGEEGFHWKNQAKRGGLRWTTGEHGTALFDIGRFMTVSLLQDDSRFEVFHGKRGIDWRVGATGQPNVDFLWSSRGSVWVDTRDQFKVKADSGMHLTTKGARGILIQSSDPYADVVLEAGVEGALVFKGHTFQMECEEWKWHGLSSFKGIQEKGWFWGATQGMIRGESGDRTRAPTDCVSHEAGIEWKTLNAEQPVRLSTQGTQSLIELESERSGLLLNAGGAEGIHLKLRNQYESQQPKGWLVDMRDAGAIDWRISEKDGLSYWRMVLDGCAEHLTFGKEGSGFQRGIVLEQMAHEWDWVKGVYDWVEEVRPLSLTGERLAIHSKNVCEREGSVIEWDWGEKNAVWKATVGQEVLFQMNQPNAHFTVQALRENSQIHLQAENAVLLQSTQANAFVQAHQDIYLRTGRLMEQTVEEGSWKVRVARTPPKIQRALDIQVNGETYCASTKKQVHRCLDSENGQMIWGIGRDKVEENKDKGFHWIYEDGAHLSLEKNKLKLRSAAAPGTEKGHELMWNVESGEFQFGNYMKADSITCEMLAITPKDEVSIGSDVIELLTKKLDDDEHTILSKIWMVFNVKDDEYLFDVVGVQERIRKYKVDSTKKYMNVEQNKEWKDGKTECKYENYDIGKKYIDTRHTENWEKSKVLVRGDEDSIKRQSWENYDLVVRGHSKYRTTFFEHTVNGSYTIKTPQADGPSFRIYSDGLGSDVSMLSGKNRICVDRNIVRLVSSSISYILYKNYLETNWYQDTDTFKIVKEVISKKRESGKIRQDFFIKVSNKYKKEEEWNNYKYYAQLTEEADIKNYRGIKQNTIFVLDEDSIQKEDQYKISSTVLFLNDENDKRILSKHIQYDKECGITDVSHFSTIIYSLLSTKYFRFRHTYNKLYLEDDGISTTVLDPHRILFQGAPGITFGIGNLQEIEKKHESFEKELSDEGIQSGEPPSVVWNLGEHSMWIAKGGSSVSWNPSQWSLHTSDKQEYLSLSDNKDAFTWEAFGTNGGMRWTVGESGQFLWEGGKEMVWRLDDESKGRMVWRGVAGGSWDWEGREEDMTMRASMARRQTVIGWPQGCQEKERSHYAEWVRCFHERGWNEARREVELGFQGASIDRAIWEEGVIAWQEYRGMKCEWIQDERRLIDQSSKTEFGRLDAHVGYTWADGSGLTFLRDGIQWSRKDEVKQLKYKWDEKRPALEWDGLFKTHGLQFGRGSLALYNNRITTENEETPIVLKSKSGILIDGPLRFLGDDEVEGHHKWDAGEGLYSSAGIQSLMVEYPRVSMKQVEVNSWKVGDGERTAQLGEDGRLELSDWEPARVKTFQEAHYENGKEENRSLLSVLRKDKGERAVQVRGGVAVDGSVEVEENMSVRGKIRRAPKKRSGLNREVPRERVEALMKNLEVVEHDEEQVEGLLEGERVSETVDLWDMVLLLTAEVQQLRSQVARLSQKN